MALMGHHTRVSAKYFDAFVYNVAFGLLDAFVKVFVDRASN